MTQVKQTLAEVRQAFVDAILGAEDQILKAQIIVASSMLGLKGTFDDDADGRTAFLAFCAVPKTDGGLGLAESTVDQYCQVGALLARVPQATDYTDSLKTLQYLERFEDEHVVSMLEAAGPGCTPDSLRTAGEQIVPSLIAAREKREEREAGAEAREREASNKRRDALAGNATLKATLKKREASLRAGINGTEEVQNQIVSLVRGWYLKGIDDGTKYGADLRAAAPLIFRAIDRDRDLIAENQKQHGPDREQVKPEVKPRKRGERAGLSEQVKQTTPEQTTDGTEGKPEPSELVK
jgi:hypothetical protein